MNSLRTGKASRNNIWAHVGLWFGAFCLYGFGDVLTTNLVLSTGGHELNSWLKAAVSGFGGGLSGYIITKVVISAILLSIYVFHLVKYRWIIPVALCLVGTGLIVHNFFWYFQL
jgi:hypothetical protein